MGKSRLVAEFVRTARRRGLFVAFGECQSFGTNTSYFVWREIWRRLLRPGGRRRRPTTSADDSSATLGAIDPALVARAPLLATVVGLEIPDTELTASARRQAPQGVARGPARDLPARPVRRGADRPRARGLPLDRRRCRATCSRSSAGPTAGLPVLIVLAYRPAADVGGGLGVERIPDFAELSPRRPRPATTPRRSSRPSSPRSRRRAGGRRRAGDALVDARDRAIGRQPVLHRGAHQLHRQSQASTRPTRPRCATLELPESLHSLVLSRIDQMAEAPRRTLKVASVVGRVFEAPVLPGAYPELGDAATRSSSTSTPCARPTSSTSIARPTRPTCSSTSRPRRSPTRACRSPSGRCSTAGSAASSRAPTRTAIERQLDLLAHHFWLSDDDERKRPYLARAADAARAALCERRGHRLPGAPRPAARAARARRTRCSSSAKVLELIGDWSAAEAVAREALALATELGDRASQGWSRTRPRRGRPQAGPLRRGDRPIGGRAAPAFEAVGRGRRRRARCSTWPGPWPPSGATTTTAQARYEESLAIRERLGDKASIGGLYSNLGGHRRVPRRLRRRARVQRAALAIRTRGRRPLGDRRRPRTTSG